MKASLHALALMVAVAAFPGRALCAAGSAATLATIELEARLASPTDVVLSWKDPGPEAAGYSVEYTNALTSEFVVLGFVPPGVASFKHPRLMPHTHFFYRVRALYGPCSNTVEAAVPPLLSDVEYAAGYGGSEDYSWAPPRFDADRKAADAYPVRTAQTASRAAPTDLAATFIPSTVSGFQFTWTDRALGQDGYLLERRQGTETEFSVCAVAPARTNSFGWALVPPVRRASFRIRPFYYGPSSNVVEELTGEGHPVR